MFLARFEKLVNKRFKKDFSPYQVAIDKAQGELLENSLKLQKMLGSNLNPALLVDHDNDDFICGICELIIEDPTLCENCDQNFCKSCINE